MKGASKFISIAIILALVIGGFYFLNTRFTGNITGMVTYGAKGAPTISSVEISPSNPSPDDDLTGSVDASDGDGDDMTYWYSWYKDDVLNATTLIDDDLISYFPLDNDSLDYYGSNDGTNNGADLTSGRVGGGYDFDGSTEYINASTAIPQSGDLTISFWAKVDSGVTGHHAYFGQGQSCLLYATTTYGDADNQIRFYLNEEIFIGPDIRDDLWHHIVLRKDSTNYSLYIDGRCNVSGTSSKNFAGTLTYIGASWVTGVKNHFDGLMDELMIFNKSLSDSEIAQLYQGGLYGDVVDSSYTQDGEEWELKARAGDSSGWSDESNSGTRDVSSDLNSPSISFSSSTTESGEHNQNFIFVGVDLDDENRIYSFINFNSSVNLFYKMNDTGAGAIHDYSGNSYDGTNTGTNSTDGKFGDAMHFDGADTIDCGAAGNFTEADNFSISIWVKGNPSEDGILQRYDGTKGWALYTTGSGTLIFDIRHNSTSMVRRRSTSSVYGGDWHHIVLTYDGSSTLAGTHVYIDGSLDDSASSNLDTLSGSSVTSTNCKVGILHTYGNYRFIGDMDEIILFKRLLSSDEISALYNASSYSRNFTDAADGVYNFYAYSQDSYGNENQTATRSVTLVSNTAPTVTLAFPESSTLYIENESLALNFSVSDDNDAVANLSCWYNIDGGSNFSISNCINTTFNTSDESSHTLHIFANDSEGLEGTDNVSFDVDTVGVNVSIDEPTGTKTSRTNVPLNYIASGNNMACWYEIKTSIGGSIIANTTLSNCSNTTFTVSTDGDYIAYVYANNTFASSGSDSSSFTVDTDSGDDDDDGGGGGGSSGSSGRITGVVISEGKLEIASLPNLILSPGDTKKLVLSVKNIGTAFLNNCVLAGKQGSSSQSWINSEGTGVKDLAGGEIHEFIFTLNVPEELTPGKYDVEVSLNCEEANQSDSFVIEILDNTVDFTIIRVEKVDENNFQIFYSLKELSGKDQDVELHFTITDGNGEQIWETTEERFLSASSLQEFDVLAPIGLVEGSMKMLVDINSDYTSFFIEEDLVLESGQGISGFFVWGSDSSDKFLTWVAIVIFLAFAGFMTYRIIRKRKGN